MGWRRWIMHVGAAIERNRTRIACAQWACFAVSCAAWAGFIRLPAITISAMVGVVATALRYMLWEGWLRERWIQPAQGTASDDVRQRARP